MVYVCVTVLFPGVGSTPEELTTDVEVNFPVFEFLATGTMISIHRPVFEETAPRVGTLQVTVDPDTLHEVVVMVTPFNVHGLFEQVTVDIVAVGVPRTTPLGRLEKVVVTVTLSAVTVLRLVMAAPKVTGIRPGTPVLMVSSGMVLICRLSFGATV